VNFNLSRKLGLLLYKLDSLKEVDPFTDLSDIDYLEKLIIRTNSFIGQLAKRGDVHEEPKRTLFGDATRALDFAKSVSDAVRTFKENLELDSITSDEGREEKWNELTDIWQRLEADLNNSLKLFRKEDWTSEHKLCPYILEYAYLDGIKTQEKVTVSSDGAPEIARQANLVIAKNYLSDSSLFWDLRLREINTIKEQLKNDEWFLAQQVGNAWGKGDIEQTRALLESWKPKDPEQLDPCKTFRTQLRIYDEIVDELNSVQRRSKEIKLDISDCSLTLDEISFKPQMRKRQTGEHPMFQFSRFRIFNPKAWVIIGAGYAIHWFRFYLNPINCINTLQLQKKVFGIEREAKILVSEKLDDIMRVFQSQKGGKTFPVSIQKKITQRKSAIGDELDEALFSMQKEMMAAVQKWPDAVAKFAILTFIFAFLMFWVVIFFVGD
jgi:hypothetical protein